jgi:formylglycine-generating enzyme
MRARRGALALVACTVACGLPLAGTGETSRHDAGSTHGVDAGTSDADAGTHDANTPDAPVVDSGSGDATPTGPDGGISCPTALAGPTMAPVGNAGFCIDTTEVTNEQYAGFLAATNMPTLPLVCATNLQGYTPTNGWPYTTGQESLPVVWIDWCDAYAYCAWAGKRLCGKIGGGSDPQSGLTDPTSSQWFDACSAGGTLAYPYGATYQAGTCYGNAPANSQLAPVASYPGCVGGYPGIYDMSGSVWEWEDSCSAATGPGDFCQIRGGSLNQDPTGLACAVNTVGTRGSGTGDRGFRCCAP